MPTFADLGLPFPLFEAPTTEASDYAGLAACRLCGGKGRHCFELGIGDALILTCPSCGVENGLDAHDRADTSCRSCGSPVPFPESIRTKKQVLKHRRRERTGQPFRVIHHLASDHDLTGIGLRWLSTQGHPSQRADGLIARG